MGGRTRQPSETGSESKSAEIRQAEGPVFVISTNDLCHVLGNTEAHYVSQLFADAFETHIFAPLSADLPNAETHRFPFSGVLGVFMLNLLFAPYWLAVGLREQPKVVYCYTNVIIPPLLIRAVTGAVVVHDMQCDPHGQLQEFADADGTARLLSPLFSLVRLGHRFVLPRSDAVVALSDHLKATLHRKYGVAWDAIHVVPLGVDTKRFTPDAEAVDTNGGTTSSSDRIRIAYLGTIKRIRGLETVVDGLAELDEEHRKQVRLDVFGSGNTEFIEALTQRATAGGVEFVYHGHISHDEVPDALAACDIAVSPLPPLDAYRVSCPAKVFEYLATGLPVVATRIPPHERHLTHGSDALLVDPEDPSGFAHAFARLLDDPELRQSMSAQARETALDQDWSERFQRIADVIATAQQNRAQQNQGRQNRGRRSQGRQNQGQQNRGRKNHGQQNHERQNHIRQDRDR